MTHPRFVNRIALVYIDKYRGIHHASAQEYAERVCGDDAELTERVRQEVMKLARQMFTGGKPDGNKPA